jgi:hypothetical protein
MATSRTAKVTAEIEKVKARITEQQGKLKELEQKRTESENMEMVDIVRGLHIPLDQLATAHANIKGGASGHGVPKSQPATRTETEDTSE